MEKLSGVKMGTWQKMIIFGSGLWFLLLIYKSSFLIGIERYFTLTDDMMISMRYAKNFANGYGLVWNPGEVPVEGYSNFLWVMWMSLLHLLPVSSSKLSLLVMLSGALLLGIIIWVVFKIAMMLRPNNVFVILGAGLLVANLSLLTRWTILGMETGLVTCLMVLSVWMVYRYGQQRRVSDLYWLGLFLASLTLTRDDSLLFVGIIMFYLLFRSGVPLRQCVTLGLCVVLVKSVHLGFRYHYYADILPNTYYLKVAGFGVLERVKRGLEVTVTAYLGIYLPLTILILYSLVRYWKKLADNQWLLVAIFISQSLYAIYVGGDAWTDQGDRFMLVGLPFGLLFCVLMLETMSSEVANKIYRQGIMFGGLFLLLLFISIGTMAWFVIPSRYYETDGRKFETQLGIYISNNTSEDFSYAITAAGHTPYFADRMAFDMLGKNDRYIAHQLPQVPLGDSIPGHTKWDYNYILDKQPDMIKGVYAMSHDLEQRKYDQLLLDSGYDEISYGFWVNEFGAQELNIRSGD